jgi:capsular polysaccharide transport system permease protein
VVFSVHAFSPGDAKRIADAVLSLSESLVNDMNDRMMKSTIADAEREFARSADRLARARAEYQKVRNESGILNTAEAGKGLADLLTLVQKERLRLQQEFDTQSRYVSNTAPQMRALRDRLRSLDDQIAELESKMTTQRTSTGPDKVLSESITRFAQQDLEHRIAERQYAAAASALELARITSQRQLVYLVAFVRPALPEESRYPRPVLFTALGILGSLAVWGAFCGLLTAIRNHMA